jgi:hypothetical protein
MEKDVKKFEKDAVHAAREYENRELELPIALLILTSIYLKVLLIGR